LAAKFARAISETPTCKLVVIAPDALKFGF